MNEDIVINKNTTAKSGEWFVDDIKVEAGKSIIHESNIRSIKVYKGESSKMYSGGIGVTVIKRKKKYGFVPLFEFISDKTTDYDNLGSESKWTILLDEIKIDSIDKYQIELNPDINITVKKNLDYDSNNKQEINQGTIIIIHIKK